MNPRQILTSMQRACRVNPAARRATLWQIAKDAEGIEAMTPQGDYLWERACFAWVIFTFRKEGEFAGVTGEFEGGFRVSVLPDPVDMRHLEMPSLGKSFVVQRFPRLIGDPIPEISMTLQKIGADGMGLVQTFTCREPQSDEERPVLIGPLPII